MDGRVQKGFGGTAGVIIELAFGGSYARRIKKTGL